MVDVGRGYSSKPCIYEGGSICNENPFITPSTNALEFNVICQTKDQSVAVIMVHETLHNIHCIYFPPNCNDSF